MLRSESPMQIRLATAAVILGTFLGGALLGAGTYHWVAPPRFRHAPFHHPGLPLDELGLSSDQEGKAQAIGTRHRAEIETIMRDTFPRVRAINEKMEKELREILTVEQQKKLDAIKARRLPLRHGPPLLPGTTIPPPGAPGLAPPLGPIPPPPPSPNSPPNAAAN